MNYLKGHVDALDIVSERNKYAFSFWNSSSEDNLVGERVLQGLVEKFKSDINTGHSKLVDLKDAAQHVDPLVAVGLNEVMNRYVDTKQLPEGRAAFDVVFDRYDSSLFYSTHVLTLGSPKTYHPADFKHFPEEIRPKMSFQERSVKGFARIVFKRQKNHKIWEDFNYQLPVEHDAGRSLFETPDFAKFDQIVEISRFFVDSGDRISSLQHYTSVYNALFSAFSKEQLSKVLIVASAHKVSVAENNRRTWGFEVVPSMEAIALKYGGTTQVMAITADKLFQRLSDYLQRQYDMILEKESSNTVEKILEAKATLPERLKNQDFLKFSYKDEKNRAVNVEIKIDEMRRLRIKVQHPSGETYEGFVTRKFVEKISIQEGFYTGKLRLRMNFEVFNGNQKTTGIINVKIPLFHGNFWIFKSKNRQVFQLEEFEKNAINNKIYHTLSFDGGAWNMSFVDAVILDIPTHSKDIGYFFNNEEISIQFANEKRASLQHMRAENHILLKKGARFHDVDRPDYKFNYGLFNSQKGRFSDAHLYFMQPNTKTLLEGSDAVSSPLDILPIWIAFRNADPWRNVFQALGFEIQE